MEKLEDNTPRAFGDTAPIEEIRKRFKPSPLYKPNGWSDKGIEVPKEEPKK